MRNAALVYMIKLSELCSKNIINKKLIQERDENMILQYKGFNNNWVYEEARSITKANINVGVVIYSYKETTLNELNDAHYYKDMYKSVEKYIKKETHCSDEIIFHINCNFKELQNVSVITLNDVSKKVTYVFNSDAYLLNREGQIICKLA